MADTVNLVRDAVDDPETTGKFSSSKIIGWLENAFSTVVPAVFANASGPNSIRWNLAVTADKGEYAKPPHVLEIFGAHKVNTRGEIEATLRPRSRFNPYGPGIIFDGTRISFVPTPRVGETYRIWFIPNGEVRLAEGSVASGSTASAVKLGTATTGTLDPRDNAYAGYILSLTAQNGKIEERMVSTSSFDGTDHVCNVAPDFTITVDTNCTYDVRPLVGKLVQTAVVLDAALMLLAFQEESKRTRLIEKRQGPIMRQLRLNAANEEQIVGGHFAGDVMDNDRYLGLFGGSF